MKVTILPFVVMVVAVLAEGNKSFKVTDADRYTKKLIVADTLKDLKNKGRSKLEIDGRVKVVFESDGTEIDDEDSFQTVEDKEMLMLLGPDETWEKGDSDERRGHHGREERYDDHNDHGNSRHNVQNWKKSSYSKSSWACIAGPLAIGIGAMAFGPAGWPITAKMAAAAATGGASWYMQGCGPDD